MFAKGGFSAFKNDLTNIRALCNALGNPEETFKAVHIAGTNGKGSTSHMLAAILQNAGYKTGLHTSPHLLDFREGIRINGKLVSRMFVVDFVRSNRSLIEEVRPSFFELTVSMAFRYFADSNVDIAIVETGLGGRLDATNIIRPVMSLITNISYDHMHILGNSLVEIACEKAGIIKQQIPVIVSERQEPVEDLFVSQATELGARIFFASNEWGVEEISADEQFQYLRVTSKSGRPFETIDIRLDLRGTYQQKNLPGVLSSVRVLREIGFVISEDQLVEGLGKVQALTGLMGRWQTLSDKPLTICDTGHNEEGWKEVVRNIARTPYKKLHVVLGVMRDKDMGHMLDSFPKDACFYFCSPRLQRALPAIELKSLAVGYGLSGKAYDRVKEAVESAQHMASEEDLVFIGGSTFVVAEALSLFQYAVKGKSLMVFKKTPATCLINPNLQSENDSVK